MTIEDAVRNIMSRSTTGQTVRDVCREVGVELHDEIQAILNRMDKSGRVESIHGGGGYPTYYYNTPSPTFKVRPLAMADGT